MRSPRTLPGHGPAAGQGPAPAHDRALSCQPPKEVTARPQRPTYRKSLVLTLKRKKTKGQTSKSATELFPSAKPRQLSLGDAEGAAAPPILTPLAPYQNALIFQSSNLVIKKKKMVQITCQQSVSNQVPDGSPRGRQGLEVPPGRRGPPGLSQGPGVWLRPGDTGQRAWTGHGQSCPLHFVCVQSLI